MSSASMHHEDILGTPELSINLKLPLLQRYCNVLAFQSRRAPYKIEYPISEVDDHERPSASWVAWWCLAEHFRLSRPQVKATAVCGLPVMAPAGQGDQQDRIWGDTGGWQRFLHMAQIGRCEGITGRIAATDLGMRRGFRQAVLPHYDKT